MRNKSVRFTPEELLNAIHSGKFKNHRVYITWLFDLHHKVQIDQNKFGDLIFDYRAKYTTVSAHSGAYSAARD